MREENNAPASASVAATTSVTAPPLSNRVPRVAASRKPAARSPLQGFVNNFTFNKFLVLINSLIPFALLMFDWSRDQLGANPLDFMTRATGTLTLIFLLISLTITPLRKLTGWNELIKHRRMLGLFAFFYAFLHLTAYLWFDKFFAVADIAKDVWRRPFILVGMTAFLLMVPLAVTSTNGMIKRLGGKRWSKLHKLTYVVAVFGVLHFWLLVKSDTTRPLIFAALLAVLLGYRFVQSRLAQNGRKPISVTSTSAPH